MLLQVAFVGGPPGGPELLAVLVLSLLVFGAIVLAVVLGVRYLSNRRADRQRIETLEREVEQLRDDDAND